MIDKQHKKKVFAPPPPPPPPPTFVVPATPLFHGMYLGERKLAYIRRDLSCSHSHVTHKRKLAQLNVNGRAFACFVGAVTQLAPGLCSQRNRHPSLKKFKARTNFSGCLLNNVPW